MNRLEHIVDKSLAWPALAWPAALLAVCDLIATFTGPAGVSLFGISPLAYGAAVFGLTVVLLTVHVRAALAIVRFAGRFFSQSMWPWLFMAALFGLSWQDTVMHGDGIRAHEWYAIIRPTSAAAGALGLAFFTWLVGFCDRLNEAQRRFLAGLAAAAGLAFHFLILTSYGAFHGHLAAFVTACATWALLPLLAQRVARIGGLILLAVALLATVATLPERANIQPQAQQQSHVLSSIFDGLPFARLFRAQPKSLVGEATDLDESQREMREELFAPTELYESGEPRGENVLVVVLESVRADYWSEPELTPRFHEWKEHGAYVPRAIAQYPATPLAYGAMFTSQPPMVLAQSPYWGENRLFDYLRPSFDDVIASQPDISWFEHNAITDFFVPRDIQPFRHRDAVEGLEYTRDRIAELDADESFFGWVHLYEPHAPYEARDEFVDGSGKKADYRSEVAWIDDKLGEFMDWFYDSPRAEDTLLIVVSDHGEGMGDAVLGEEFWGHHVHVHEVVSRVPLYMSGPGLPQGAVEEELPVAQLDIMPTVVDFLGAELPADALMQGRSVYSLLEERPERPIPSEAFSIRGHEFFDFVDQAGREDPDEIRERFHEISTDGADYSPKLALQYGRYKIVYDRMVRQHWLYDTEDDPMETRDLSEERPEKLEEMKQRLDDWVKVQNWTVETLNEHFAR